MKVIDVYTGEVKIGSGNVILRSMALGSCVAVVVYDTKSKTGGIAHVLLPGKSPRGNKINRRKYAFYAIDELIEKMLNSGAKRTNIKASIVGGGNVLKKKDDTISKANVHSVIECLTKKKIGIIGSSVGGIERRSVSLDIESGDILFSVGDSNMQILKKADLSKYITGEIDE
ncbi:chemotaxis protein CheD [Elusimicrobiota bacterium]